MGMKTKEQAARNYEDGITGIGGAAKYLECGGLSNTGFMAVAKCLHDAKKVNLTTAGMAERYRNAA